MDTDLQKYAFFFIRSVHFKNVATFFADVEKYLVNLQTGQCDCFSLLSIGK